MTDQQINQRIAEACGLKPKRRTVYYPKSGMKVETVPPPSYCSDLNAMHDAEKTLTDAIMFVMAHHIERLVSAHGQHYFHASARQRAEAFLRALGKWEEVQG